MYFILSRVKNYRYRLSEIQDVAVVFSDSIYFFGLRHSSLIEIQFLLSSYQLAANLLSFLDGVHLY